MEPQIVVTAAAAACTVAAFLLARRADSQRDGASDQYIRDKLDTIGDNVRSTRDDVREIRHTIADHEGRLGRLEVRVEHLEREGGNG